MQQVVAAPRAKTQALIPEETNANRKQSAADVDEKRADIDLAQGEIIGRYDLNR